MPFTNSAIANRVRSNWLIIGCANGTVPIVIIWKYHAGEIGYTVALLAGAIVLTVGNIAILLGFRQLSKREGGPLGKRLVVGAAVLAIAAFLATILGVSVKKHRNGYLNLALSDVPLSSIEPVQRRLVVELIRRTNANSQEENKAMAEAQKVPMNPAVYSAQSFADQQIIQSTLAHLAIYTEIDFQYSAKQQSAREDFRRKMAVCDAEYLTKWDAQRRRQEDTESAANQIEHNWFTSVKALYDYAEQHARNIAVIDGRISISDVPVRQRFNDLFDQSKALHEKLESAVREEIEPQQKAKANIEE